MTDPQEAIRRAREKLAAAEEKTPWIDRIVERLERAATENNFTHRIARLYREAPR